MVADRALTPATRHRLGEPLPHQQADRMRTPLEAPELYLQIYKECKTIEYYPIFR